MDPNLIAKEKKIPWHLVGVFLLLSIGIIVVGYIYYDYEKSSVISDVKSDLAAFAELKVKQINSWRRAHTSSASSLPDNRYFIQDVNNFLGQSSNANKSKLVQWLLPVKNGLNFKNIFLFDQNGKELLKIGNQAEPMNQFDKSFITNALRKKQVSFSNFHFNFDSTDIHIDLIATIGKVDRENKEIVGAILFRIDPRTDLYPLIQLWPKQSKSAEMLLVSKDGDSVRFLNDLRFVKNAPVRLAFSSGDSILPAALAVRGITGIVKGRDYRNVDVYASLNKIQDSPWFLVSKIDKSEIEEPLRERMISLVVIVLLLVIVTGSVIILFWYRQRSHYIHQRLIEEIERKAILAHFDQLVKYSNDIYLLLDPNFSIIEANNKVLSEYGYTRDEIRQLLISDLTPADKKDFIINKLSLLQNDDNIVLQK